jgi:TRAP-type uncharacterized transport system substrate-binding protein
MLLASAMLLAPAALGRAETVTLGLLADGPQTASFAVNIARAVDHEGGLRILPVVGKGPVQSLSDLLKLREIDAALVPSDTLLYMERNNLMEGVADKVAYLVRLAALDVHLVAREGIATPADLAGRTVAIGGADSAAFVAGQLLVKETGLAKATIEADGADAVAAVLAGKADAALLVGRKPLAELAGVAVESRLRLLAVAAPSGLDSTYAPSLLSDADYPRLVKADEPVETVSAALVVAVFNWKKGSAQYRVLERFAAALFAALQPASGGDAGLNLAASVPGWSRHEAAEGVLSERAAEAEAAASPTVEN